MPFNWVLVKSFFSSHKVGNIIVFILLLPLLYINVKSTHDWGDDFAAYINQADALLKGELHYQTGFIPNLEKPDIQSVSIGFTLLELPVIYLFGHDIYALSIYLSIILIACSFIIYKIADRHVSTLSAIVVSLIFCYSPWMLSFKQEILSDIPAAALILLTLYFYNEGKNPKAILSAGIIAGFATFVRPISVTLYGIIIIHQLLVHKKYKTLIHIIPGIILYIILTFLIFPGPDGGTLIYYLSELKIENIIELLQSGFKYYYTEWGNYLYSGNNSLLISLLKLISILCVSGILTHMYQKKNITGFFIIVYLVSVFLWPDRKQGNRFLLPVISLLFLESFWMVEFFGNLTKSASKIIMYSYSGIIVFVLIIQLNYSLQQTKISIQGPFSEELKSMYSYIKKHPGRYVFTKPRSLIMMTGCTAMYPMDHLPEEKMKLGYKHYNASSFVLIKNHAETSNKKLTQYLLQAHHDTLYQDEESVILTAP